MFEENNTVPIEGTTITQAITDGIDNGAFTFDIDKASVVNQGWYNLNT